MPWPSGLVEGTATNRALDHRVLLSLLHEGLLAWVHFLIAILLDDSSEGHGLGLPLWHFFIFLLDLYFLFHLLSLPHQLLLVIIDEPVLLGVKLLPFLLEYFLAVGFMFLDAVGVELAATAHSALPQLRWVILHNVDLVFPVDLLDAAFLAIVASHIFRITVGGWIVLGPVRVGSPSARRVLARVVPARIRRCLIVVAVALGLLPRIPGISDV